MLMIFNRKVILTSLSTTFMILSFSFGAGHCAEEVTPSQIIRGGVMMLDDNSFVMCLGNKAFIVNVLKGNETGVIGHKGILSVVVEDGEGGDVTPASCEEVYEQVRQKENKGRGGNK